MQILPKYHSILADGEKENRLNKRNTWGTRHSTMDKGMKTGMSQPYNKGKTDNKGEESQHKTTTKKMNC